ncbi:hypothetical protein GMORB2_0085 [Geosmithia morbida]|uniref:Uncharacterized protein n=1 Tax=Geosmithia morbida TaxID=1094350 RepID=A0A9P5D9B4_9HYPO|nr:uncharacterized protein GMORB2_0085 [Geosmithia morbida]KAF4126349.1 hypothetical protein GMORB2_0085 [Geosmithia morbida]
MCCPDCCRAADYGTHEFCLDCDVNPGCTKSLHHVSYDYDDDYSRPYDSLHHGFTYPYSRYSHHQRHPSGSPPGRSFDSDDYYYARDKDGDVVMSSSSDNIKDGSKDSDDIEDDDDDGSINDKHEDENMSEKSPSSNTKNGKQPSHTQTTQTIQITQATQATQATQTTQQTQDDKSQSEEKQKSDQPRPKK